MTDENKLSQEIDSAKIFLKNTNEFRLKLIQLQKMDEADFEQRRAMVQEYKANIRKLEEIGTPPTVDATEILEGKLKHMADEIAKSKIAIDEMEKLENEMLNLFVGNHIVDLEKFDLAREKLEKLYQEGQKQAINNQGQS